MLVVLDTENWRASVMAWTSRIPGCDDARLLGSHTFFLLHSVHYALAGGVPFIGFAGFRCALAYSHGVQHMPHMMASCGMRVTMVLKQRVYILFHAEPRENKIQVQDSSKVGTSLASPLLTLCIVTSPCYSEPRGEGSMVRKNRRGIRRAPANSTRLLLFGPKTLLLDTR